MANSIENVLRAFSGRRTGDAPSGNAAVRAWNAALEIEDVEETVDVQIWCWIRGVSAEGDQYTVSVPRSKVKSFVAELLKDDAVSSVGFGSALKVQ